MRKKLRRKKRKHRSILMLISVPVIAVIIVVALYYGLQPLQQPQNQQKEPVESFFEIINPTVNYGWFGPNETVLFIEQLGFTLKSVGGDAHDVIIQSTAMSEPVELVYPLLKNQTRYIELYYGSRYLSQKTEEGFPVEIKIWSKEAAGTITIFLEY